MKAIHLRSPLSENTAAPWCLELCVTTKPRSLIVPLPVAHFGAGHDTGLDTYRVGGWTPFA
ncbi:hypothetical protein [Streptomyces canus]|uniref:hypothetical protein n=1 Tax=Streptomyces canus TaxID=58343 RepID=UPI003244E4FF